MAKFNRFLLFLFTLFAFQVNAQLSVNINSTSVSCANGNDGTATATVSGGTNPMTYNWSNGIVGGSTVTGLSAGSYSLTVIDAVGATGFAMFTINAPSPLVINMTITDESASGAADGSITTSVFGGTPPFTYNWSGGVSASPTINNLVAGTYCVTVSDVNACTVVSCGTVNQSSSSNSVASLVITEIMYNPPESGADSLEYIEFFNADTIAVDLTGYSFSQGISHTFNSGIVQPAQYYVIAIDSNAHFAVFGQMPDAEWSSGALSNGGEDIALRDNLGRQVDSVDYDDSSPWPSGSGNGGPDGGGASIELFATNLDNNVGSNWFASNNSTTVTINGNIVRGSPGSPNVSVGISESNLESGFSLYPNPNQGEFQLKMTSNLKNSRMQIFSIDGTKKKDLILNNLECTLRFTDLKAGIYLIQIGEFTQKMLIQH